MMQFNPEVFMSKILEGANQMPLMAKIYPSAPPFRGGRGEFHLRANDCLGNIAPSPARLVTALREVDKLRDYCDKIIPIKGRN